jgi:hypothetical protein
MFLVHGPTLTRMTVTEYICRVGGVTDILRYPVLRSKTLIMYFNWFASSFMLYGLALNWQHLTGFSQVLAGKSGRKISR